jgi:hypothetical protein
LTLPVFTSSTVARSSARLPTYDPPIVIARCANGGSGSVISPPNRPHIT